MVATSVARKEGHDIIHWSRHQLQGKKVATSFSGCDISYKERRLRRHQWSRHQLQGIKVAPSFNGRNISYKELRSRHHSVVATSITRKEGRDVISGRDISYKERRSQHHSVVATSDPRDAKGKSRPTLQKTADLATDFSGGFYPLQFNDGLATATNLATDLPTDNIPSPK